MNETVPNAVFEIVIADTGETYACPARETLLKAMARLGRKGIPSGCHGGGCGVCKVRVRGDVDTLVMSRSHVSEEEERQGYVLACRCYPRSCLSVQVVGKLHKAVTRPRYGLV